MDKICWKRVFPVEKRKSEHHHWILYVRISPGAKFQLKLTILIIWTKFTQKGYFRLKLEKMNITIELCIFEPSLGTKFQLKLAILIFWTKFTQKCYFRSKLEKINITIEFCLFELVFGYIIGFWYIGPNLPKKSISSLKQKSSIFACVHGRHLLYQTFPYGRWQTQRYFSVSSPSSRRDKKLWCIVNRLQK